MLKWPRNSLHHLLALAGPHQAVVDEDAGELVADRLVDQHRGDRRIDAAGKAADDAALADLGADRRARLGAEGGHRPVALHARRPCGRNCGSAARRRGCGRPRGGTSGRSSGASRRRSARRARSPRSPTRRKAGRQAGDAVAVAHPHDVALARLPHAVEQRALGADGDLGAAEFAVVAAFDLAAELFGHGHLAVADAEHRHAGIEDRLRRARGCPRRAPRPGRRRGSPPWASAPRRRARRSGTARSRNRPRPRAPAGR